MYAIRSYYGGIVLGNNLLDIYVWFFPEYADPDCMQLTVNDLKQNGNLSVQKSEVFTRADIGKNADWQWMWAVEENDFFVTDPYEWEGYDGKLISYTQPLVIEGKVVAAVSYNFV